MANPSSGEVLRGLRHARDRMRKAREVLRLARKGDLSADRALAAAWESLQSAHRLLAYTPVVVANEDVMTQHLAVQRYATSLLVRLRRLVHGKPGQDDDLDVSGKDED